MRVEKVTAHAFGPFQGETIELADGMTVVHGPNEAGKSSWQAALFAGLCGMRRGRGAARAEDREFEERHKPWGARAWRVDVRVRLDDGREAEIRQNLADKTQCQVTDAVRGTDLTGEILNEGTPDGAKWLGLDRDSFAATAFVGQADILAILEDADELQEHIQRAAASSDARETAAGAIGRIDAFLAEHVGSERSTSTKPLRAALDEVEQARRALEAAAADRLAHAKLRERAEALDAEVAIAQASFELAKARARAAQLGAHVERCRALAQRLPEGAPAPLHDDVALAQEVAAALEGWRTRPTPPVLEGRTAQEIQGEIDALPQPPRGDVKPHPAVERAASAHHDAAHELAVHAALRPHVGDRPAASGIEADELRELAAELAVVAPSIDPALQVRVESAEASLARARSRTRVARVTLGLSVVLVVAGGALLLLDPGMLARLGEEVGMALGRAWGEGIADHRTGGGVLATGLIGLLGSLLAARTAAPATALDELRNAETALGVARFAVQDAQARRQAAAARLESLAIAAHPDAVRALADALVGWSQRAADHARWEERRQQLARARGDARGELLHVLASRGATSGDELDPSTDPVAAWDGYRVACEERADIARRAATRAGLEIQLKARRELETIAAQATARVAEAAQLVADVARRCGSAGAAGECDDAAAHGSDEAAAHSTERLVSGLSRWSEERRTRLLAHERRVQDWATLSELLGGRALPELEAELTTLAAQSEELAARLAALAPRSEEASCEASREEARAGTRGDDVERRRAEHERLALAAERARTEAEMRAQSMPSMVEAEERLKRAEERLEQVRALEETLGRARAFLAKAQESVYRDAARFLTKLIRPRLSLVTDGRYVDVRIDPDSLEVSVLEEAPQQWRKAHLLSRGTAEQVYLLVRVALAERLPRRGEACPLLLDDVTVQSDAARKVALLDLLHRLSDERQVVVFSQEEEVLAWARDHLSGPRDAVIALSPRAARGAGAARAV